MDIKSMIARATRRTGEAITRMGQHIDSDSGSELLRTAGAKAKDCVHKAASKVAKWSDQGESLTGDKGTVDTAATIRDND